MIETKLMPRFSDTDGLGHVGNTVIPVWFEEGRTKLFEVFHPTLDIATWPMIIARIEVDFIAQIYWGSEVTIRTGIQKLGSSSCHIAHEAWQKGNMVAKGVAVMVYFDYEANKSIPVPDDIREKLKPYQLA